MTPRASLATVVLVAAAVAAPAAAAPTSPDSGFGGDGKVLLHSGAHPEHLADMVVLPKGKTLVLTATSTGPALELWRLRANGTPDPSFGGGDGMVAFAPAADWDAMRLAVDPATGKSYVSAFIEGGANPVTVWRITAAGVLDTSYGGGSGSVTYNGRYIAGLATQPGGKLLMVGNDANAHTANIWRLDNSGDPDPSFGAGGSRVLSNDVNDAAEAVLVQPDRKIVVAGSHYDPTVSLATVYRLRKNGAFDPSFSGDGRTTINPSSPGVTTSTVFAPALVLRPDGRLALAAGLNQNDGSFRTALLVAGLKPNGKPDGKFGKHVVTQVASYSASVALQRDGMLLVGGLVPPTPSSTAAILRFTPKGALDSRWSGDGILPVPGTPGGHVLVGLAPTGRILAARTVDNAIPDTEILAFKGTKTPRCRGKLATQFGTKKADRIKGTSGADVLVGLGGKDKIRGRGGKDIICGNGGGDRLFGGPGNDKIYGQGGNDLLVGNQGKDQLKGGPGKNKIRQ